MKEEQAAAAAAESSLHQASQLLSSLISYSYSTRCFPGKWQLIRNKLEQLLSVLTAAATSNFFSRNWEAYQLLKSISSALNDVDLLLHRCGDESYDGGKLRMRSDLDAAVSRLELHCKKLSEMYSSGNLMQSQAIILSKPSASASREDMRFYVKDLFSRLKIGDVSMRIQALSALHEILCENEKYVHIVTIEVADVMALLVSFLELSHADLQEGAAMALSAITEFDSYKGALVAAGVIAPLIQVLEKGTELGRERAAQMLRRLTEKSDNGWSVSAHGGITVLLRICSDVNCSKELIVSACQILRNLSSVEEMRRFMVEEGVIPILLNLTRSKEEACQVQAIDLIDAMASADDGIRQNVVRDGIIVSLLHLLDPNSPFSSKAREVALRATNSLCFSSANSLNVLMNSCFIEKLLFFLKHGEISVQELALETVSHLCEISDEYRKAMGNAGFMTELVRLLEAKSSQVREKSAETIYCLICVPRNRRRLIQDEHFVSQIMRLLDLVEEKPTTKKHLLSILKSVAESNSGRKKIMASGCVHCIERLAEADELVAKKVMKKLSSNRFRSILNGIWTY
ncbi:hypothetical protein Cni_G21074 [Canna indica]|uniref:DUF7032 domain-containing protein n=1 Tax=Canna indica TaxID=4628 RepID=A0AAQ3KSF9_9LILI|nr:hypothetical protein Cni_G21074 [Canna indica]